MLEFLEKAQGYSEYVVLGICLVFALIMFSVFRKSDAKTTKTLVYGAICIALSCVLNLVTLFSMPNGGSVTLARLVPLLVFSYVFGFKRGFVIGFIYGILDFIAKPYFVNIFQFLLDYPIAFSAVGFAGIFNKTEKMQKFSFAIGAVIAGLVRFLSSTLSGVFYWGLLFVPSMAYNSVLLVDSAVCLILIIPLQASKSFRNLIAETRAKLGVDLTKTQEKSE